MYSRPGFSGVTIPTLSEVIEVCEKLDLVILLEIKGFKGFTEAAKVLARVRVKVLRYAHWARVKVLLVSKGTDTREGYTAKKRSK